MQGMKTEIENKKTKWRKQAKKSIKNNGEGEQKEKKRNEEQKPKNTKLEQKEK